MAKSRSSLSEGIKYVKVRYKSGKYREYDKATIDIILKELEKLEAKLMEKREDELERMVEQMFEPKDKDINFKNHTYKQARIKGTKY